MSYKKFGQNDVIVNTMRAHPNCEFFIYDSKVYYNNKPEQAGSFSSQVLNVPPGHVSLYEYNIDRAAGTNPLIYPFIIKGSNKISFKSINKDDWTFNYSYGDQITSSYPLSASIRRELMTGSKSSTIALDSTRPLLTIVRPTYRRFFALKNKLDFYGTLSEHYKVSSSFGDKNSQSLNLISIPSIFYGSGIKPGTVNLKWYLTGSLIGEIKDEKQNGELIQVGPVGSTGSGSVAGVVLYKEGFILLTGSWSLGESISLRSGLPNTNCAWLYFGAGALDGVKQATGNVSSSFASASFDMSFKGTNDTQVLTMFAHAGKGEVNYSNNPTFLKFGQAKTRHTSSLIYEENPSQLIYNTVSSSFAGHDADYKNQVYISKVAIYDDSNNLLGVAAISNPILKEEDQDLSFKIKLDI
tara:strand:+ start:1871 stop:3103 length:1233 start_codon:yes stop_codon:yes gene_type:complete